MNYKPNDPRHPWSRLVAAARQVHDDRDTTPPYGFSTRVAALSFQQPAGALLFEPIAFRALSVAALLALFSIALNYQVFSPPANSTVTPQVVEPEQLVAVDDAVAIVLDFAD